MKIVKKHLENIRRVSPKYAAHSLIIAVILSVFAQPCLAATRMFTVPSANGTDDTVAIQTTLNAAANAFNTSDGAGRSGIAVIFPLGTYKISSRLVLTTTNCPIEGGGIMIRGQGRAGTIIASSGAAGALLITNNVDGGKSIRIQIEDIQFQTAVANAGPAIEVSPYMLNGQPLAENNLTITPVLRNVRIARTDVAYSYSYGFKGNNLRAPLIDDVVVMGTQNYMEAGIQFDQTYAHNIKDCTINGAKIGVYHHIGGEGNMFNRMTITNVTTGIKIENVLYHIYMSPCGGSVLNSSISASECGVSLIHKADCFISNNQFNRLAGGAAYTDVSLTDCTECFITGNSFTAGSSASQTNVALVKGSEPLSGAADIIVSDNTFRSSAGTGVSVSSGVDRAMIFNNQFGMTAQLADNGTSTRFISGAPQPFISPAAAKDTESFSWGNDMGTVYDVTAYGAAGNGTNDDTAAIQAAASSLTTYLNGGATRKGILYFPAGTYKVKNQISMAPTSGANLTICGDGMRASAIERYSGGTKGVFKLDFANAPVRADIHNLMIFATYADAGDAVYIKQPAIPGAGTGRNLYMHNILMDNKWTTHYFSNCVYGVNLAQPFFENVIITMGTGTNGTGLLLTNSWGLVCDKFMVNGCLGAGLNIASKGGDVLIKNTTGCVVGPDVGARIDAGGGRVAIEGAHFNANVFNLDITNAAGGVSFVSSELLNHDLLPHTGWASLRLANCTTVDIRNIVFTKCNPLFINPNRRSIWLYGAANSAVNIYGSMFLEAGKTCVYTDAGSAVPAVTNNFFARTDIDDIEGPGQVVMVRLYPLNGESGEEYLLRNKVSGKYLNANSTAAVCTSTDIRDDSLWTMVYDRASGNYTLQNKTTGKFLTKTGTSVDCSGTATNTATLWNVVNRQDGWYNIKNGSSLLNYTPVDQVNCSTADTDSNRWEAILSGELEMGMDKVTMDLVATTSSVWTNVNFIQPFPQPPAVFVGGPSCNDTTPLTVRVRNVTTNGFEFRLAEWASNDDKHDAEEVSFIAVHKGRYQIEQSGTRTVEAGTLTAGTSWVTKPFSAPFSTVPCVFAQCTSTNGAPAVCTRLRNVTATNFQVRIEAKNDAYHVPETVDFIAIDPGLNLNFEVGRSAPCTGSGWATLSFTNGGGDLPGFVGSVQSSYENDPCALRYQNLTGTNVQVKVDEDGGTAHAAEDIGWMVFENPHWP